MVGGHTGFSCCFHELTRCAVLLPTKKPQPFVWLSACGKAGHQHTNCPHPVSCPWCFYAKGHKYSTCRGPLWWIACVRLGLGAWCPPRSTWYSTSWQSSEARSGSVQEASVSLVGPRSGRQRQEVSTIKHQKYEQGLPRPLRPQDQAVLMVSKGKMLHPSIMVDKC